MRSCLFNDTDDLVELCKVLRRSLAIEIKLELLDGAFEVDETHYRVSLLAKLLLAGFVLREQIQKHSLAVASEHVLEVRGERFLLNGLRDVGNDHAVRLVRLLVPEHRQRAAHLHVRVKNAPMFKD